MLARYRVLYPQEHKKYCPYLKEKHNLRTKIKILIIGK